MPPSTDPPSDPDRLSLPLTGSGQLSPSLRHPWLSSEAESSNAETLNELPLGGLQSGVADAAPSRSGSTRLPPHRHTDSRQSDSSNRHSITSQRMSDLRAEMRAHQAQIQQLTEAHQAVHNAVSGINATQELLKMAPRQEKEEDEAEKNKYIEKEKQKEREEEEAQETDDEEDENMAPVTSQQTKRSTFQEYQEAQDLPEQPMNQPPHAERQGWVDEEYYETNPWYGQAKKKPVFSLGRPLPHTSRFKPKPKEQRQKAEPDLESGEGAKNGRQVKIAGENSDENDQQSASGSNEQRGSRGDANTHENARKGPGYEEGDKYNIGSDPLGQQEQDEVEEGKADPNEYRNWWARFRAKYPEPLAEFLCTGMTTFLGLCATISVNLSQNQSYQYGTYETSCWAWGFAMMLGIYIGGGVSGAHMSPAISICLWIFRGFPGRQLCVYIVIQFIASIVAAALAYGVYYDAIHYVDPGLQSTYTNFFSSPQPWVTNGGAATSTVVAGAVQMITVFALGDDQNNPPGAGLHAFIIGMVSTTMKFCFGYNTGSALNPASDFGPRVLSIMVGYRSPKIFQNSWWIYGPWASSLAGSLLGCVIYDALIFVGSESPINYRVPQTFRKKKERAQKLKGRMKEKI